MQFGIFGLFEFVFGQVFFYYFQIFVELVVEDEVIVDIYQFCVIFGGICLLFVLGEIFLVFGQLFVDQIVQVFVVIDFSCWFGVEQFFGIVFIDYFFGFGGIVGLQGQLGYFYVIV